MIGNEMTLTLKGQTQQQNQSTLLQRTQQHFHCAILKKTFIQSIQSERKTTGLNSGIIKPGDKIKRIRSQDILSANKWIAARLEG